MTMMKTWWLAFRSLIIMRILWSLWWLFATNRKTYQKFRYTYWWILWLLVIFRFLLLMLLTIVKLITIGFESKRFTKMSFLQIIIILTLFLIRGSLPHLFKFTQGLYFV